MTWGVARCREGMGGGWGPWRLLALGAPAVVSPALPASALLLSGTVSTAVFQELGVRGELSTQVCPAPFPQTLISDTARRSLRYGPADTAVSPQSCVGRSNEQAAALECGEQRGGTQPSRPTPLLLTLLGKRLDPRRGRGREHFLPHPDSWRHVLQQSLGEEVCDPESLVDASVGGGRGITGGALASGGR